MQAPLLLFGLPRSGTTWLGKIFDSHPDTLYWHEPDSVWQLPLTLLPEAGEGAARASALDQWLRRLESKAPLKALAKQPLFPKRYLGAVRGQARRGLVLAASAWGRIARPPALPYLVPAGRRHTVVPVWKSIESLGRLGCLHEALPGIRSVHILRHPCGYIASVMRGEQRGKFDGRSPTSDDWGLFELLLATPQARAARLDMHALRDMQPIERLAWRWRLFNAKAMDDLCDVPASMVSVYDHLCDDPQAETRRLFDHCGLSWNGQTEAFLAASTSEQEASYYSVFKDPRAAARRWHEELDAGQVQLVLDICLPSAPGRLFEASD